MKVLVAMTHYGTKNRIHAQRLVAEYRSMPYDVDIVVLCEAPKNLGPGVSERIGMPTEDPWSLPFAHKKVFTENADRYDLFIYTEDDTLIRKENIEAFLRASEALPVGLLPGFIRYELHPDGQKNYNDIHGPFHWVPGSVRRHGEYVYATLSNAHSACYALSRQQLRRTIDSGGFAVAPHSGRYDLACSAATDPYTQCGFQRVICLSHLDHFELHHLPNAYLNRMGLSDTQHRLLVGALLDVFEKKRSDRELFVTEKSVATPDWDRSYDEPPRTDLLRSLPTSPKTVLSIGSGSGATEALLIERGAQVTAVPLDAVIACLAQRYGVRMLPPDFTAAFEALGHETFDAIILPDVLQHVSAPCDVLARLARHLKVDGVVVGSVPNLPPVRRMLGRVGAKTNRWVNIRGPYEETRLHLTSMRRTRRWLKASGLRPLSLTFDKTVPARWPRQLHNFRPAAVTASNIVFVAGKSTMR